MTPIGLPKVNATGIKAIWDKIRIYKCASTEEATASQQSGRGMMILQCNGKNLQLDEYGNISIGFFSNLFNRNYRRTS